MQAGSVERARPAQKEVSPVADGLKRLAAILSTAACLATCAAGPATGPYHSTPPTVDYKCLFNHELLIITHNKQNNRAFIQAFIEKLTNTDVDAVMCCPTMWRMNLFPSQVDQDWKKYSPDQPLSKFPPFDYIMRYLHAGGDPVRDTLEACRKCHKDFFISYRMNDHHYVTDLTWPSHNSFWREHPEYWLGNSGTSPYTKQDNIRIFNYLIPAVRDYYFAILEELCTNYDVDGVELDFQRFPKFFPSGKIKEGTAVMTAFVGRIKALLDRIGKARGKSIKLCVRVPETPAKCLEAGLDMSAWDALGLVNMINISSFYRHTMELDLEAFKSQTQHAKLYGEMNYVTTQNNKVSIFARRFTTVEIYRATALNFLQRGADGMSLFNYDYIAETQRVAMARGLKGITDVAFLKTTSKDYAVYPGFGTFPASNAKTLDLVIPDDTKAGFDRAVLRVETVKDSTAVELGVHLNGKPLEPCPHADSELFPPLAQNAGYPTRDRLKFYAVPLALLIPGTNHFELTNLDRKKGSCQFFSLELALYHR